MAEIQRDKDIIRTPEFVIDPVFELPPDLDEGSYELGVRDRVDNSRDLVDDDLPGSGLGGDPDGAANEQPGQLQPFKPVLDPRPIQSPFEITVKSQTFRYAPDGSAVVDVVLEFPDVAGATSYEVRIAK